MNYLELCKTVRREIGLSGDGPTSVKNQSGQLAQLVGFVQSADLLIQNLWTDWNFLWDEAEFITIEGQEVYAPPQDFNLWDRESLYLDWGREESLKLNFINEKEDIKFSGLRELGKPLYFVELPNNKIKLNPIPDSSFTVTGSYYKRPIPMVENTDTSLIPPQFHRVIVARAKMMYAEAEEIYNQMQANQIEYVETLRKLEAHSLKGQHYHSYAQTEPLTVRPV